MSIEWLLAYLALGAFVGFFAGLLGVGGGGIMVPLLTTMFAAQGFPREHMVHLALGTSMAAIVLTSLSSLRAHHAHGAVRWDIVRGITPGVLFGTFAGTFIAAAAPTLFSRLLAGALTLVFFIYAFVNMGMVSGILPVVGVPLPFVSYGGTAMVTLGVVLGILMSIAKSKRLMQS